MNVKNHVHQTITITTQNVTNVTENAKNVKVNLIKNVPNVMMVTI